MKGQDIVPYTKSVRATWSARVISETRREYIYPKGTSFGAHVGSGLTHPPAPHMDVPVSRSTGMCESDRATVSKITLAFHVAKSTNSASPQKPRLKI